MWQSKVQVSKINKSILFCVMNDTEEDKQLLTHTFIIRFHLMKNLPYSSRGTPPSCSRVGQRSGRKEEVDKCDLTASKKTMEANIAGLFLLPWFTPPVLCGICVMILIIINVCVKYHSLLASCHWIELSVGERKRKRAQRPHLPQRPSTRHTMVSAYVFVLA